MTARQWTGPVLDVIGIGLAGEALSEQACQALRQAERVIGAPRHFEALERIGVVPAGTHEHFPSPFSRLWDQLDQHQGRQVALLASGDPLFYGLGGHLRRHLSTRSLRFHPAVSSVQAAFARIGQPWQEAQVISLHGRPLASLRAALQMNRWFALLTDADSHPVAIARELVAAGFAASRMWVCEDLGTPNERVSAHAARALGADTAIFSPLNVVIVETDGAGGVLPEFPGLPDTAFSTDGDAPGKGLLTKREVRLCALSLLAPQAGDIGWDIGAGCGGIAVEWARWMPLGQVHAVECHAQRLHHLGVNRERFGVVRNLHVHAGRAPEVLSDLPAPDAVFVGGGGKALATLLDACWARLPSGGRLVASAVTEDARLALHAFGGDDDEWVQVAISRGERLAGQRILRPQLPVLLLKRVKP